MLAARSRSRRSASPASSRAWGEPSGLPDTDSRDCDRRRGFEPAALLFVAGWTGGRAAEDGRLALETLGVVDNASTVVTAAGRGGRARTSARNAWYMSCGSPASAVAEAEYKPLSGAQSAAASSSRSARGGGCGVTRRPVPRSYRARANSPGAMTPDGFAGASSLLATHAMTSTPARPAQERTSAAIAGAVVAADICAERAFSPRSYSGRGPPGAGGRPRMKRGATAAVTLPEVAGVSAAAVASCTRNGKGDDEMTEPACDTDRPVLVPAIAPPPFCGLNDAPAT